ncbi:MAG: potassium channel family protein [Congregibacter sp.]
MLKLFIVNSAIIALVVFVHYEFLHWANQLMPKLHLRHRARMLFGVFSALLAHIIEVWIFAIAYYLMDRTPGWGSMGGDYDGSVFSSVYLSFASYTTLGIGDIVPLGHLRFLVALESLTGFVLITWTASFLYLEMTRNWHHNSASGEER